MALSQLQRDAGVANMLTISYHYSDAFSNSDATSRISYYGITGYPHTYADGTLNQRGSYQNVRTDSARFAGFYNTRRGITSPLSIVVTGLYNRVTRQGRVKATVTNTGSTQILNHRLRYVIVETVPYNWQWTDTCWEVCRKMLPNASGVTISLMPSEAKADSQSFTMGSGWVEGKTWLVAFVQNDANKEVLQGGWAPLTGFSGVEGGAPVEPVGNDVVLAQNRPNPTRGGTEIAFSLPKAENVRLAVYDAQGRLVRTLVEGNRSAGTHQVSVSGLESGVYFYRLETGKASHTRRMVVAK